MSYSVEELEAAPVGATLVSKKGICWTKVLPNCWGTDDLPGEVQTATNAHRAEQDALCEKSFPDNTVVLKRPDEASEERDALDRQVTAVKLANADLFLVGCRGENLEDPALAAVARIKELKEKLATVEKDVFAELDAVANGGRFPEGSEGAHALSTVRNLLSRRVFGG
jgi:hypothetical protein